MELRVLRYFLAVAREGSVTGKEIAKAEEIRKDYFNSKR